MSSCNGIDFNIEFKLYIVYCLMLKKVCNYLYCLYYCLIIYIKVKVRLLFIFKNFFNFYMKISGGKESVNVCGYFSRRFVFSTVGARKKTYKNEIEIRKSYLFSQDIL